jgi:hypothetical protein
MFRMYTGMHTGTGAGTAASGPGINGKMPLTVWLHIPSSIGVLLRPTARYHTR